jgi:hypothetical protein
MLDWALWYRGKGFSLIPVRSQADKKPLLSAWKTFQNALPPESDIRSWWTKWPDAGIGIITGKINNLTVVDFDYRNMENGTREAIEDRIPDTFETPTVVTPQNGDHFWFLYDPDIPHGSNINGIKGIDARNDGGYIIAPPSMGPPSTCRGKYSFKKGLSLKDLNPKEVPSTLKEYIFAKAIPRDKTGQTGTCGDTLAFTRPGRDETLFHIAWTLQKGGMASDEIRQVIDFIASKCDPPFPPQEAWTKVQSAFQRGERRTNSVMSEIRAWLNGTKGDFTGTEVDKELGFGTKGDKESRKKSLQRLVEEGLIERVASKPRYFRVVDTDMEKIDWQSAAVEEFPVRLPFHIEKLVKIYPKNIIVIAGEFDAGKTTFLLNLAVMNCNQMPVHYFSSEMGDQELRMRMALFDSIMPDTWSKIHFWERDRDFHDVIAPDDLNIIDFLELYGDYYQIAGKLADIYRKLGKGIAVVALQKPSSRDWGEGGEKGLQKPRLYLSLSKGTPPEPNTIKIVKAKNFRHENPVGLELDYKLIKGSNFLPVSSWQRRGKNGTN